MTSDLTVDGDEVNDLLQLGVRDVDADPAEHGT